MAAMSDYLEAALLNHIFRSNTFSKPTTLYVALLKNPAVDADTGTTILTKEPTAGGYVRKPISVTDNQWSVPGVAGLIASTSGIVWTATGGDFGMISGIAYCDASGAGNMLLHGSLTTPRDVLSGETFTASSGNLSVTFA